MTPDEVSWEEFYRSAFKWRQDQHVSLIGPTEAGKTTLALAIMDKRRYSVTFGTKPADATLTKLQKRGYKRIGSWDKVPDIIQGAGQPEPQRLILWPRFKSMADQRKHPPIFRQALEEMFAEGGWCCFADEVSYVSKDLGLDGPLKRWWQQGRSVNLSLVAATQRPVWVPPEMYTQAQHLFFWASNDERDLKRLSDIGGPSSGKELANVVRNLDFTRHQVLYLNVRNGESIVTIPPKG